MKILVTGGTGAIGQHLLPELLKRKHELVVLTRSEQRPSNVFNLKYLHWDGQSLDDWKRHVHDVEAVVNLAGAGIADNRWTNGRKQEILLSRVNAGKVLQQAIVQKLMQPKVFLQASAIGYYPDLGEQLINENTAPANNFLSQVCMRWEHSTSGLEDLGVRRVIVRSGLVLDREHGVLPRLLQLNKFYTSTALGKGTEYQSWIHWMDEIDAMIFLLTNKKAEGIFNLTSANPVTAKKLDDAIIKITRREAKIKIPTPLIRFALGELADNILLSQRVQPQHLLDLGYRYKFDNINVALQDLLV